MNRFAPLILITALGVGLASCAAGTPDDGPDPDAVDPAPPAAATTADCLTGGPWSLDLPDYTEQAQAYLTSLGIPVENLAMEGTQILEFTSDGLMAVQTDITSTGVIVVEGATVPFDVRSTDGASGDWSVDDESLLTIENFAAVPGEALTDPLVDIPLPDYSTIDGVGVTCQPGLLSLATDAPLVPLFRR